MRLKSEPGILALLLILSISSSFTIVSETTAEAPEFIWNSEGDFGLGSFDTHAIYNQMYSNAPLGSSYWGVEGYSWNDSDIYPIYYSRFAANGSSAFLSPSLNFC